MKQHIKNGLLYLFATALMFGCKKEEELKQINPAQHNHLIKTSRKSGDGNKLYYYNEATPSGDGNLYYYAYDDQSGKTVYQVIVDDKGGTQSSAISAGVLFEVGKMTPDGDVIWAKNQGYRARHLLTVSWVQGSGANSLLTAGQNDTKFGSVSLFSSTGTSLSTVACKSSGSWINHLTKDLFSTKVIGFGGCQVGQTIHPFICEIEIGTNGQLSITKETILSHISDRYLVGGVVLDNPSVRYVATWDSQNINAFEAVGLDATYQQKWTKVVSLGESSELRTGNHIITEGDKIYVCGFAGDNTKTPAPSNGGSWHSGIVSCFKVDGQLLWQTKGAFSNKQDIFLEMALHGNEIYLVGEHSAFFYPDDKSSFSNGLITKINKQSGAIMGSYTFSNTDKIGDREINSSNFRALAINGNQLTALGLTNMVYDENSNWKSSQGWVVKVNLSDL